MVNHTDHGVEVAAITAGQQALNQFLAALITMAFALIGGMLTGKGPNQAVEKKQASHCCTPHVCLRQSVNQLYNNQNMAKLVLFSTAE